MTKEKIIQLLERQVSRYGKEAFRKTRRIEKYL